MAAFAAVIREHGSDVIGALLDTQKFFAKPVVLCRQGIAERVVEPRPGAHGAGARLRGNDFAGAIETDDLPHLHAHGLVEGDSGPAQDGDELWMRAEPDAAAG